MNQVTWILIWGLEASSWLKIGLVGEVLCVDNRSGKGLKRDLVLGLVRHEDLLFFVIPCVPILILLWCDGKKKKKTC